MAAQQAIPTAQVVGNAFVHQYYHILHQSPELVYRFYQDGSKLGRPEAQGVMSSITTMEAINEKILSMEYSKFRAEIKTVDAQDSLNRGVLVLVTGYLTGKDNVRHNFTQSFFLAPQDKGFYVLNDMFRYMDEAEQIGDVNFGAVHHGNEGAPRAPITPEDEPAPENHVTEQNATIYEEDLNGEEVYNPSDNEGSIVVEEAVVDDVVIENHVEPHHVPDANTSPVEDTPKKSYASIVKVMKENAAPLSVPLPPPRPSAQITERQAAAPPPAPAPEMSAMSSNGNEAPNHHDAEVPDGHSIYIKGLSLNATSAQLEEEFKKFGPVKPGGIQVRSNRQQGFCFGFVQFESAASVQSALEASPLSIGGRQAFVEEKRASGSRGPRGRYQSGRGGYRNEVPRGSRGGGYGGARGYARGEFNNRSEYGGRGGRGMSNRGGEGGGYQRVEHVGNGERVNRTGGANINSSTKSLAPRVPATA